MLFRARLLRKPYSDRSDRVLGQSTTKPQMAVVREKEAAKEEKKKQ